MTELTPGFNSSLWKYALLVLVGGIVAVRVSPAKKQEDEEKKPYLTELIESFFVPVQEVQEENRKHLDWSMKKAEAQLLFQDAQKPPAHRFKFPAYVSATDAVPWTSIPSAASLLARSSMPRISSPTRSVCNHLRSLAPYSIFWPAGPGRLVAEPRRGLT